MNVGFFLNDTPATDIYTLSLHDALPISTHHVHGPRQVIFAVNGLEKGRGQNRSEEHTSELQSRLHLVCRLLLEKKKHAERRDWQRPAPRRCSRGGSVTTQRGSEPCARLS